MIIMKKLNINEVHTRLLEVADAVDKICSNHDIPLFMVAGTMLGAIRHRGFIPWDDDMDFGVPYEHFYELMGILETELPSRFHCLTYENGKDNLAFHIKVEDHETIARDIRIDKPLEHQPGITIDIFPIVCCDEESFSTLIPKIRNVYMVKRRIFIGSTERQNYKKWAKRILRFVVPFSSLSLNRKIKKLMDQLESGPFMSIPVSPNYWNRKFKKEWFYPIKRFKFEDREYVGICDYDAYLKSLYRNYMKLPPKEKQIVHMDDVYLRES